jgi:transcriptional regulator with XRE-family HTH domain
MKYEKEIKQIAKQIREVRKKKGYSQEDFAYIVGISRGYYGYIERGQVNLTLDKLIMIAKALKVQPKELIPPKL